MEYFRAVNPKQLDLCLKMLFDENVLSTIETLRNSKGKIEYCI